MPNGLALAIYLLTGLLFLAYIVSMILNFFTPFYSTPKKILNEIVDIFKIKKNQKFVDLGSGEGRVVFATNKKYGCLSVGYEISPILLMIVKLKKLFLAPFNKNVKFKEENFFNAELKDYDVIYCCLQTDTLQLLERKFEKELKKGTVVYTYKDPLPKKKGKKIVLESTSLYRYTY